MSSRDKTVLAGMFFIGCFVGGVVTNDITGGSADSDFKDFIPAALGGAFGVAVVGFGGDHMKSPHGILGYGLGLIVSML